MPAFVGAGRCSCCSGARFGEPAAERLVRLHHSVHGWTERRDLRRRRCTTSRSSCSNLSAALANIDCVDGGGGAEPGELGLRLFRRVVFPLALPGYVAGAALVFIKVFDDLGTPLVLNVTNMLAPQAYLRITSVGVEDPIGYVICVVMLVLFSHRRAGRLRVAREAPRLRDRLAGPRRCRSGRLTPWQRVLAYGWSRSCSLLVLSPHLGLVLLSLAKVWSFSRRCPTQYTLQHYATGVHRRAAMIVQHVPLLRPGRAASMWCSVPRSPTSCFAPRCPAAMARLPARRGALAMPGLVLGDRLPARLPRRGAPLRDGRTHGELAHLRGRLCGAPPAVRAALVHGGALAGAPLARGSRAESAAPTSRAHRARSSR